MHWKIWRRNFLVFKIKTVKIFSKRFPKTPPFFWDNDWFIWKFLFRHTYIFWSKILTFLDRKSQMLEHYILCFLQFNAFFSLGMVVISTLTFIVSTLEDFKEEDEWDPDSVLNLTVEYIDTIVIVFFTLEYFLRFVCSPRKWKFIKDPMNMVDLIAIIPFYLALALNHLEDIQIIGMYFWKKILDIFFLWKKVISFANLFPPRNEKKSQNQLFQFYTPSWFYSAFANQVNRRLSNKISFSAKRSIFKPKNSQFFLKISDPIWKYSNINPFIFLLFTFRQSWQNSSTYTCHENSKDFQVSSTFCWLTKSAVYFETSLQGTWTFDAVGCSGHSNIFEFRYESSVNFWLKLFDLFGAQISAKSSVFCLLFFNKHIPYSRDFCPRVKQVTSISN